MSWIQQVPPAGPYAEVNYPHSASKDALPDPWVSPFLVTCLGGEVSLFFATGLRNSAARHSKRREGPALPA